jgi:ribonuclease BN (tRNA processing enzyme)
VNVRFWGTRGSVPTPGPQTQHYGGNTSCVEVCASPEHLVVLDAGSGIRVLGGALSPAVTRVDILLSHLHMDHIIGLGFFSALFEPDLEVHIWGPSSTTLLLRERLARYLSPPLFPVRIRDLPCQLTLHDVPFGTFNLPSMQVTADLVCHPGPTVGYRLDDGNTRVTYLSDHEPALGVRRFPDADRWTSGYDLAAGVDTLIHDSQFLDDEYEEHIGWGHSTITHALTFADLAGVGRLVAFHYDPAHDDDTLDALYRDLRATPGRIPVIAAQEGLSLEIDSVSRAHDSAGA